MARFHGPSAYRVDKGKAERARGKRGRVNIKVQSWEAEDDEVEGGEIWLLGISLNFLFIKNTFQMGFCLSLYSHLIP